MVASVLADLRLAGTAFRAAKTRLDGAHQAFLDDLWRESVQGTVKRITGVNALAEYPCLSVLPVHVVAEQHLIHAVDVWVIAEHDVAGEVEREAVDVNRTAPAADAVILLE